MAEMKWWGWGAEGVEFTHADKPDLAPFIQKVLRLDVRRVTAPPPSFASLRISESSSVAIAPQRTRAEPGAGPRLDRRP